MIDRYGLAVVHERTTPRRWDGVAAYLRQEYGPGTTVAYLLAVDGDRRRPAGRMRPVLALAIRRLARRLRAVALPGREARSNRALACDGCAPAER